jgi:hypothetical protein
VSVGCPLLFIVVLDECARPLDEELGEDQAATISTDQFNVLNDDDDDDDDDSEDKCRINNRHVIALVVVLLCVSLLNRKSVAVLRCLSLSIHLPAAR